MGLFKQMGFSSCLSGNFHLLLLLLGYSFFSPSLLSAEEHSGRIVQGNDTVFHLSHNDLKVGERLFYGLLREQKDQASCISCHTIHYSGEFNWNPSADEIAASTTGKTFNDLSGLLRSPSGKKMSQVHTGYDEYTDLQIAQIKGFLDDYHETGGGEAKPVINNLLTFIGLTILFLFVFLDLVWFRKIPFRVVHVLLLFSSALFITRMIVNEAIAVGRSENYEPDQPIKFSHLVHAGQNLTDCLYCHSSAEFGKSAGLPAASVCLNCHMVVREGARSGRFEINKIFTAVEQKKPIAWTRVYNLPDHAFFSHAQHVGAGKLQCQTCHGPVETMDRIRQVPDLSMGWCINCHRDTEVQFHTNEFYSKYAVLHEKLKKGEISEVNVEMVGGTDCMKCHY